MNPNTLGHESPNAQDRSIGLGRANLVVIAASFPVGLALFLLGQVSGGIGTELPALDARRFTIFLAAIIFGITFHEVLHALGWIIVGRLPARRVGFGFKLRTLSPYAHLRGPVPARVYRAGVLLPLIVLGFVPYLLGILSANGLITVYGLFFILAAGGDVLVLWLLRAVPGHVQVEDHPSRAGCVIYPEPVPGNPR